MVELVCPKCGMKIEIEWGIAWQIISDESELMTCGLDDGCGFEGTAKDFGWNEETMNDVP